MPSAVLLDLARRHNREAFNAAEQAGLPFCLPSFPDRFVMGRELAKAQLNVAEVLFATCNKRPFDLVKVE
jgi:hypothetical protein